MSGILNCASIVQSSKVLGPYDRGVLWVHGCTFSCKGCLSNRYKNGEYSREITEDLARFFLGNNKMEGITISGGEPFLQASGIIELIKSIKERRDIGVIVYTGFTLPELVDKGKVDVEIQKLLDNIDILIDGPYVEELDENQFARGSSNQNIILLTSRYEDVWEEYYGKKGREIEITTNERGAILTGVPSKNQLEIWNQLKKGGDAR